VYDSRDLFDIHNRERRPGGILKTEGADIEIVAETNTAFLSRALARLRAGMILLTPGAPILGRHAAGKGRSHGVGRLSQAVGTTERRLLLRKNRRVLDERHRVLDEK